MDKVQKSIEALHAAIVAELDADPDLPGVLRACLLGIKKELEAFQWALRSVWTDTVAEDTLAVNERIAADWNDPKVQVDPNVPHRKPKAKKAKPVADEPALD